MFELPECLTLARQMNTVLTGKSVRTGNLGNSPHKFVWYNRGDEEFARLVAGKVVGEIKARGRWIIIQINPGYVLLLGECGGKILFLETGQKLPKKYHLQLIFNDESYLTVTTQMWGAMELFESGQEQNRDYLRNMRTTPIDPEFTYDYFSALVDSEKSAKKRSVKSLLTQEQTIPGLGNAIAQDILFRSHLHPRHPLDQLDRFQKHNLYEAIVETVTEVLNQGGRYDEFDLFGNRGGYVRLMDAQSSGQPCPECGTTIQKIQYLGGACYLCPACQI